MTDKHEAFTSSAFLTEYRYDQKSGSVFLKLLLKRKPTQKQQKQLATRNAQQFTVIAWETDNE